MDNSQLAPFLESIVKAYCSKYISTWLQTATNDEIKGLKVVQAIIKHKGQKRFKVHEKQERFDIDQAKNDVRRRTMTSFYTSHYSSASPSHSHISEILKYKKLSELPYSQILTPTALQLIENWVKLDDDAKFKDLLLTFLQGVNSVCKINGNLPVTSNQDTFQWFSKEEKERMNFPVTVRNTKVQFFDRKKSHSLVSEQKDLIPLKTFYEPKFYQDRMVRKMRGSGDFINWVYDQNGSIYQHSFASRTNKIPTEKAVPANSSTVIRVLPKASVS